MNKKELLIQIEDKLGINKENNSDEVKLSGLDTDREYQVRLAKELWNDKITIENKFWNPEDYYYLEDFMIEEKGFEKIGIIKYGNSDKTFLKFNEWKKEFKIYYNRLESKILVFVSYEICKDRDWNLTDSKHFIGIFNF